MRAKILTLRFCSRLGRFDDSPLIALQQRIVLDEVQEHLVHVGAETMLVCVARWREQPPSAAVPAQPASSDAGACAEIRAIHPTGAEPLTGGEAQPDTSASVSASNAQPRQAAVPLGALRAELDHEQRMLFDRLRAWRNRTAHAEGAPPYVVLTNRQLVDLARLRPSSKQGLGTIRGLGEQKIARRGDALLQLLWAEPTPATDAQSAMPTMTAATTAHPVEPQPVSGASTAAANAAEDARP